MNHLLFLGMGYCGRALAGRLKARGWSITGTTRNPEKAKDLEAEGIRSVLFNGGEPMADIDNVLAGVTHVIASIPPDDDGDLFLRAHNHDLARHAGHIQWAGYLSTTGVYGDSDGEWVGEDAPTAPTTRAGTRRLLAEQQWQALAAQSGLPLHIFRIAGIYGPGTRNQIDQVKQGTAKRILKANHYVGRVHRDDIVGILEASIAMPNPGRIYNVVDHEPSAPEEVIAFTAQLLGIEPPPAIPFEEADPSGVARNFFSGSKRVSNARVREELGYSFLYPTYREGMRSIISEAG